MGPWLALAALWGAGFCLSCRLTWTAESPDAKRGDSVAGALLGQSRHALSAQLYGTADQFFHKGVPHLKNRAFEDGFFLTARKEISPEGHFHLRGDETAEMLPWLWMALRMDPHNVEIYRVAAFWLASDARSANMAYEVLLEAQRNNPGSHQVKLDMGRLFLREGKIEDAEKAFTAAINFWPGNLDKEDPEAVKEAMFEKAEILLYRALLHELQGEIDSEIGLLEEIVRMFPERAGMRERIDDLRKGEKPVVLATRILDQMLEQQKQQVHQCDRDDEHEEHEHDHEHDEHCKAGCSH
jgi:tetratricopeptide (TPR) repeat protein